MWGAVKKGGESLQTCEIEINEDVRHSGFKVQ